MSLLAHDAQVIDKHHDQHHDQHHDGASRIEQAQQRFDQTLSRLETALAAKLAKKPVTSSDDSKMIDVLREEIEELRHYNSALNDANKSALSQVELTIGRLKGMVEV